MSHNTTTATSVNSHDSSLDVIGTILKDFLRKIAFEPPSFSMTNEALEAAMRTEMVTHNLQCPQLERTLHLAAGLIELSYHEHSFEEKKLIAFFNWYALFADDMNFVYRDTPHLREFQLRLLRGLPQLDPVLQAYTGILSKICDDYDTPVANSILTSTFDFINFTYLEPRLDSLPPAHDTTRFPWFLRDRTGVAIAFALMMFPKTLQLDVLDYIQAVPDMDFWICVTNDLMSFYKEELAGETTNYVHVRARAEGKTPIQIVMDMESELHVARTSIVNALSHSPAALRTWLTFERGYVAWHLGQDRYQLKNLGLQL